MTGSPSIELKKGSFPVTLRSPAIHDRTASMTIVDFEFNLLVEAVPASNILGSPVIHDFDTPTFLVGNPFLLIQKFPQFDCSFPQLDYVELLFLFFQNVDITQCLQ